MSKKFKSFLFLIYLFIVTSGIAQQSAYQLCLETFVNTKNIKTMQFTMEKQERIDDKMVKQISTSKLQREPYLVYSYQDYPKKGLEVLYGENLNDGKILVNTNGFPWVNVHLDPMGSIARKEQHHTIKNSGFDLVISILEFLFDKYGEETKPMLNLQKVKVNDVLCHKITFTNPNFKLIKYKVQPNETLLTIAEKYMVSEYMILERNKHLSDYNDVKAGDEILIPNDYSPKMELLIEEKRMIPFSIKVFDDKGLYEYYKYSDVILNPTFTESDFDKNNSKYGF